MALTQKLDDTKAVIQDNDISTKKKNSGISQVFINSNTLQPRPFINNHLFENFDAHVTEYANNQPFKHIVIDNFFDENYLKSVVEEFPDLQSKSDKEIISYKNSRERKLTGKGEANFGPRTKSLMHYMNSEAFLVQLQKLTGIKETLIPDPYFFGGGFHEIKPGGYLKVHADFNRHQQTGLDRRVNLLVYLNDEWSDEYHGDLQLWTRDMKDCVKSVMPKFNRVVIFNTDDFSYHGLPDPVSCPDGMSRKSLALYYYSNGRPESEISTLRNQTLFKRRPGKDKRTIGDIVSLFIPPVISKIVYRLQGRKYE